MQVNRHRLLCWRVKLSGWQIVAAGFRRTCQGMVTNANGTSCSDFWVAQPCFSADAADFTASAHLLLY